MKSFISLIFILGVLTYGVLSAPLTQSSTTNSVESTPYNSALANTFVQFSAASYCPKDAIANWTCALCGSSGTIQSFKPVAIVIDELYGTQAYIGVMDSIQAIVVSFRGSSNLQNWIDDLYFIQCDFDYPGCPLDKCRVHRGFFDSYNSTVRKGVVTQITALVTKYPTYQVYVTGHSLGAAQAALCAIDLTAVFNISTIVYNYGEPRIGNKAFSTFYNSKVPNTYRIVHDNDIVPHLPPQLKGTVEEFHHVCTEYFQATSAPTVKQCDSSCEDPTCMDSIPIYEYSAAAHGVYLDFNMSC